MNFLSPQNFIFALLLGAILGLYILRMKRRERTVSSTMLWQTALRDLQANAPWQKLRSSLLMWLQLAFVMLCVFALARPAIQSLARGGQNVAIVLDASASMNATDVAPSRFARAQNEANRLINLLSSGDSAAIISAGSSTRVLSPLTRDKNVLKRAVANAQTQDTSNNLRDAISLAASLLQKKGGAQIYVLSDGAVTPINDVSVGAINLQFVKIGERNNNVAITALDARRSYAQGSNYQLFATVRNFSSTLQNINLQLMRDGQIVAVRPLQIAAKSQQSQLFDDINFAPGLWSVRFEARDDLATDNVAYVSIAPRRALRVLLVSEGNVFLERALNINADVRLFQTTVGGYAGARAQGEFDVVVCDGEAPPDAANANLLMFGATPSFAPVEKLGGAISGPSVADYDRKHPVTQFAPWNDVRFAQSQNVKLKSWAKTLVEAERTPLVVAGERGGKRVVWCGFRLNETDLALRVAFPIFVTNAVRWLSSTRTQDDANAAQRTGQPVSLDVSPQTREVSIALPDKSTRTLQRDPSSLGENAPLVFAGADQVGEYAMQSGVAEKTIKSRFGASLLNAQESDIAPRDALKISDNKTIGGENTARSNRELWGFLAFAALMLLAAEWWVYHRGV